MDLIDSDADRPRFRPGAPSAVLAALLVLAGGQVYGVTRDLDLPADVRIAVEEGGYVVGTDDAPSIVTFQLRNLGRPVEVRGVRVDAPGLRVTDVGAYGDAVAFRSVGAGADPLPPFRLVNGVSLVLTFEATDCAAVDTGIHPVRLDVRDGARSGEVALRLRDYPDLLGRPLPDVPWQGVLAAALCG